jgi:hypothetical protein
MSAMNLVSQATQWLSIIIRLLLFVALFATLAKVVGVNISVLRGLGHVELAYLAGAFWLTR